MTTQETTQKTREKIKELAKELGMGWSEKWSERWLEKWSERWSEKWSHLPKREQQILLLLIEDSSASRIQLSERIGINPSAVQKHLYKLKLKGILKRVGSPRGGYWKILR